MTPSIATFSIMGLIETPGTNATQHRGFKMLIVALFQEKFAEIFKII
jgi:hypothetical protein